tara:strand:+ start:3759 stop:4223 length:465 start_codon:yes stop_codon:yes gene_type:complete
MKTYIDALYYTLNVSTTLGNGDITPITKVTKINTIIHSLLVFFSVSTFVFQSESNFALFAFANLAIIYGMTFVYKSIDPDLAKDNTDYTYFSVITHTTVGFGDHKAPLPDKTKIAVVGHIVLMFLLLNTFNKGVFSILRKLFIDSKVDNYSMLM